MSKDRVTRAKEVHAAHRCKPTRTRVSAGQMRIILMAVEHGFREGERGKNLQGALASVHDMYEVHPE